MLGSRTADTPLFLGQVTDYNTIRGRVLVYVTVLWAAATRSPVDGTRDYSWHARDAREATDAEKLMLAQALLEGE